MFHPALENTMLFVASSYSIPGHRVFPFACQVLPTTLPAAVILSDLPDARRIDGIFQEGSGAVIAAITNECVVPLTSCSVAFNKEVLLLTEWVISA